MPDAFCANGRSQIRGHTARLRLDRAGRRPLLVPVRVCVDNLIGRLAVDRDAVLLVVALVILGASETHAVIIAAAARRQRLRGEKSRVGALNL